jgi:hypothetical protein
MTDKKRGVRRIARFFGRRRTRSLVPAGKSLPTDRRGFPDDPEGGTAGVREPRRPLPRAPQGAAELPVE